MGVTNSFICQSSCCYTHNTLVSETTQVASLANWILQLPAWVDSLETLITIITNNPTPTFPDFSPGLLVAECLYVLATRQAHIPFRDNYYVCVRIVMTSTVTHPVLYSYISSYALMTINTAYKAPVSCLLQCYRPWQRSRRQITIAWHGGAWHEHKQWVAKCGLQLRSNSMNVVRPQGVSV